jgi:ribokinase
MPKVVVFGSACVDVLMNPETLPRPGNTVLAKTYVLLPGGKGANQACACAMASRDGGEDEDEEEDGDASEKASKKAKTAKTKAAKAAKAAKIKTEFVGAVGADAFGEIFKKTFAEAGVGITGLATHVSLPTAVASVVVDAHGENQIAVGSGANLSVSAKRLSNISRTLGTNTFTLHKNDVLLLQMEIPVAEVADAVALAHTVGAFSVLNVAPSAPVPIAALEVRVHPFPNPGTTFAVQSKYSLTFRKTDTFFFLLFISRKSISWSSTNTKPLT